jgi:hypothetical protein
VLSCVSVEALCWTDPPTKVSCQMSVDREVHYWRPRSDKDSRSQLKKKCTIYNPVWDAPLLKHHKKFAVKLHSLLTLAVDEGQRSASHFGLYTHWIVDWVVPRCGLIVVLRISALFQPGINPGRLHRSQSFCKLRWPAFVIYGGQDKEI